MKNIGSYIWNFISKFSAQILWLITTMVLTRYLTPDDFGMIGVLSLIFMVANILSEAGLGGALVIQKELKEDDCSTIFTFNMVVSCSLYLLVLGLSNSIERFYEVEGLALVTRVICLVFVINAFACVPRTILYHRLQFKQLCIITIFSVVISSVISIVMAVMNFGVYSLVTYQISLAVLQLIGLLIVSKYRFVIAFRWSNFKSLFSFGFFTTFCGVIDTIYENLLAAIYGKCFNMTQAGYLSQAKKIEEASTQALLSTVNTTAFPILSKLKDDKAKFKLEALSIWKLIPILIFPILIVLMVYSKETILLLFGEQWLDASSYLSLLIIAGMFMIMDSITRNFIKSLGKVKELLYATVIKRIIACILIVVFAFISIDLIMYGYILSSIIGLIVNLYTYHTIGYISIGDIFKELIRPIIWILPLWALIVASYYCIPYLLLKLVVTILVILFYYAAAFRINNKLIKR